MSTFLENEEDDWALVEGKLVLVNDARATAQEIEASFEFFLGEWFLDVTKGVPWYQRVMQKNPDINLIRNLFRTVVLKNPAVQTLTDFALNFDKVTRKVSYTFSARRKDGTTISGGNDLRFT
jgi:hypothetical protein